jgi:hypothetical protein
MKVLLLLLLAPTIVLAEKHSSQTRALVEALETHERNQEELIQIEKRKLELMKEESDARQIERWQEDDGKMHPGIAAAVEYYRGGRESSDD